MKPHLAPLFDRIKTSKNLPTLPHILLKLIDACNNPGSTIQEISQIIDKDSSLSARVMKMVNSAYFSLPVRVTGVEQALRMLGTEAVKNIAVSAAVSRVFGATKGDDVFKLKLFWYHCLLCGTLAELIAKKTAYGSPDEAFLSGLLHDIGKLVLWVNFPRDYTEVLLSSEDKEAQLLAEQQRLGVTHSEVGAWMIGRWHLQSFMADAVLFHHEPTEKIADALPLVKIVFLANLLSIHSVDQNATVLTTAEAVLGFSQSDIDTLVAQGRENVKEVADSLGIEIEFPEDPAGPVDNVHQKEVDLLRNVRDFSLLQGTLQNLLEAYGEKAILGIVKQGLQVLFDVHDVLFLLHDEQEHILVGKGGLEPPRDSLVKEMVISLETKNCLPVQSLEEKRPLDSFGQIKEVDLTIIDRQIVRLLDKEGILCLPMIAHNKAVGAIILAVEQTTRSTLFSQMNLLTMFTQQAALALYADGIRDAQSKVVQSERLGAASAIARKVVHEVNNPLGIIKNYIKIFGLKLPNQDPVQEELKIISEELDRVALIVGRLSDFSEPEAKQTEPVDINALISDLVKITEESLMLNAKVKTHLALEPSLPRVFSEKNPLKQVLINLMKNAVEAMSQGGNLYVSTDYIQRNNIDGSEEALGERDSVQIRVRDDGPGISDSVKTRLFEPFVTSKKGEHAGLGLSVAYGIIKELNGTIACESGDKQGTTFTIVLPVGPKHRV
jgi:signal transduction histidine kinase/HD-like signal output (HDOD) protein